MKFLAHTKAEFVADELKVLQSGTDQLDEFLLEVGGGACLPQSSPSKFTTAEISAGKSQSNLPQVRAVGKCDLTRHLQKSTTLKYYDFVLLVHGCT